MSTNEAYVLFGLISIVVAAFAALLVGIAHLIYTEWRDKRDLVHATRMQWIEDMYNYYDGDADEALEEMANQPGYGWLKKYKNVK